MPGSDPYQTGAPDSPSAGFPLWGKILIGCGVLALLALGACVGLVVYVARNPERVAGMADTVLQELAGRQWSELREAVDLLMTDDGARALYRAHPGLAERYADEPSFLEAARAWRGKLEPVPPAMPSIATKRVTFNKSYRDGRPRTELTYLNGKGARITLQWDQGDLAAIRVE